MVMVLIHLKHVRRVKRKERKELKKEFLEARQELEAIRNGKNQPREQERREVEGPNERVLNQKRLENLNLIIERALDEKLAGLISDQTRAFGARTPLLGAFGPQKWEYPPPSSRKKFGRRHEKSPEQGFHSGVYNTGIFGGNKKGERGAFATPKALQFFLITFLEIC